MIPLVTGVSMRPFLISMLCALTIACSSEKDVGDGIAEGEVSEEDTCSPGNAALRCDHVS